MHTLHHLSAYIYDYDVCTVHRYIVHMGVCIVLVVYAMMRLHHIYYFYIFDILPGVGVSVCVRWYYHRRRHRRLPPSNATTTKHYRHIIIFIIVLLKCVAHVFAIKQ